MHTLQNCIFTALLALSCFIPGTTSTHPRTEKQHYINPEDQLVAMANGFLLSRALYVVAELNIPDELAHGPKTAKTIAQNLNLDAHAVFRLLRMLAAHGVFVQNSDDTFALNDLSRLITTTHPQSLHDFILHEDEARWHAYGAMTHSLQTGEPTFNHLFKEGYFDYIARDAQRSAQFDKSMATFSERENKQIAAFYNFAPFHHIIDVGGGVGGLLSQILQRYPDKQATLYELPHLKQLATEYITQHNLDDRMQIVTGSFMDSVITGGDLYVLKRILHDWSDEVCITILKNHRTAMSDNAHLLIFDCILPEGPEYDISKDIDIIMMVLFGGKERTQKDFEKLCNAANLSIEKMTPISGTMLCAIELVKQEIV